MAVSSAFTVAKGGFTTLAGQVDHQARAAIAELRRRVDALEAGSTMQTWNSPIAGGIDVGDGTTAAFYSQVGSMVFAYFKFTLGVASAITGEVSLTLPVDSAVQRFMGVGYLRDASGGQRLAAPIQLASNTTVLLRALGDAATPYLNDVALSATIPFVWTTNDALIVHMWYYA